jgi:uncharacterized membrane protein
MGQSPLLHNSTVKYKNIKEKIKMNEVDAQEEDTTEDLAKIIYILYLVGLVFGVTGIVGVIMAYINKDDAPDWVKTHYQF